VRKHHLDPFAQVRIGEIACNLFKELTLRIHRVAIYKGDARGGKIFVTHPAGRRDMHEEVGGAAEFDYTAPSSNPRLRRSHRGKTTAHPVRKQAWATRAPDTRR
jgi:hypothetical protein